MCVFAHAGVLIDICSACGSQRMTLGVVAQGLCTLIVIYFLFWFVFEAGPLTGLELAMQAQLMDQLAS